MLSTSNIKVSNIKKIKKIKIEKFNKNGEHRCKNINFEHSTQPATVKWAITCD